MCGERTIRPRSLYVQASSVGTHDQELPRPLRGQIELDNVGLNGTPANEPRYSDERVREAFFTAREVAQLMDGLGFDGLWTAENLFQREGYEVFPNPIQLGLWTAHWTSRSKV
jgi:hypothetical protein